MTDFDLVVRNGTVVTAVDTVKCDVGVRDGRIAALGENLPRGREEIDAAGLLALPGGVDSHVHVDQRGGPAGPLSDTFETASLAAAFGGVTTFISHVRQEKGGSLAESLADYTQKAKASIVDYAFHLMVTDVTEELLARELPDAVAAGHTSIKIFMATGRNMIDDRSMLALLDRARALGALPVVHAENHAAIEWLTGELVRLGRTAIKFNGAAKPAAVEREAIHRATTYAGIVGVPIHIFHVTSAEAVEEIERARRRGVEATAETCPQYLYFTEGDLDRPIEEAAKLVFGPPPRSRADQEALWSAIRRGAIDILSSDHAPYPWSGPGGKLEGAARGGFSATPHGIPGLETWMPLVFSAGVAAGRIDLNRFVALTATNPAKRFGLYPRKGTIAVGADADLALWDADRIATIRNADLHHRVEYSPYEGLTVKGGPVCAISRGETILRDGRAAAAPGRGRLIRREPGFRPAAADRAFAPAGARTG